MRLKTNCLLTLALTFLFIASDPLCGQGAKADSDKGRRQKFEETLRWKLSSGDPSENTKIEVNGNQIRITLTGGKSWNEATAGFEAKYFGLLCLLWDIEARDEEEGEYMLSDSFDVTLVQGPDKIMARALVNRADFPTLTDLNSAILLTKSQVRDILKGQAIQFNRNH